MRLPRAVVDKSMDQFVRYANGDMREGKNANIVAIAHAKQNEVGFFRQERWTAFREHLKFNKHSLSTGLDTQRLLAEHGDPEISKRQSNYLPGLQYLGRSWLHYTDDSIFHNAGNDAAITLHLIIWILRCDTLFERLRFLKQHLGPVYNDILPYDFKANL